MEGEQTQVIDLSSNMDVHSNDMLVPVGQPKFQHNRQQFQGQYLPSSIRFEHDGWAAGDCVYDFKIKDNIISKEGYTFRVAKFKDPSYYIALTFDPEDNYVGYFIFSCTASAGIIPCHIENGNTVIEDILEEPYTVVIDKANRTVNCNNPNVSAYFDFDKGKMSARYLPGSYTRDIKYSMPSDIKQEDLPVFTLTDVQNNVFEYVMDSQNKIIYDQPQDRLSYNDRPLTFNLFENNTKIATDLAEDYIRTALINIIKENFIPLIYDFKYGENDGQGKGHLYYTPVDSSEETGTAVLDSNINAVRLDLTGYSLSKTSSLTADFTVPIPAVLEVENPLTQVYTATKVFEREIGSKIYAMYIKKYTPEDDSETFVSSINAMYRGHLDSVRLYAYTFNEKTEIENTLVIDNRIKISCSMNGKTINDTIDVDNVSFLTTGELDDKEWFWTVDDIQTNASGTVTILSNTLPVDLNINDTIFNGAVFNLGTNTFTRNPEYRNLGIYKEGNYTTVYFEGHATGTVSMPNEYTSSNADSIVYTPTPAGTSSTLFIDRPSILGDAIITKIKCAFSAQGSSDDLKGTLSFTLSTSELYKTYIAPIDRPNIKLPPIHEDIVSPMIAHSYPTTMLFDCYYVQATRLKSLQLQLSDTFKTYINHQFIQSKILQKFVNEGLTIFVNPMNYTINGTTIMGTQYASIQGFVHDLNFICTSDGIVSFNDSPNNHAAYEGYEIKETTTKNSSDDNYTMQLTTRLNYHLTFNILSINDTVGFIVHKAGEAFEVTYDNQQFFLSKENIYFADMYFISSKLDDTYYLSMVSKAIEKVYNVTLKGLLRFNGITAIDSEDNIILQPGNVNLALDDLDLFTRTTFLDYQYTLIDEKELDDIHFHKHNACNGYQFLKQQWNTTSVVENYWWVDKDYILELTDTHFNLKEKTANIHDWDGDVFTIAKTMQRTVLFADLLGDQHVFNYAMASMNIKEPTYDNARFYTLGIKDSHIVLTIWKIDLNDILLLDSAHDLYINKVEIGNPLNARTDTLNTYSEFLPETLLSQAKFSSTIVEAPDDIYMLLGIHFDNNFNQWTIELNLRTHEYHIIQGYGFVGLNGSLTGGEIPTVYFDASKGFNSTVYSLSKLNTQPREITESVEDFRRIDCGDIVVGTEAQQWYITEKLTGIVSHIKWTGDYNHWAVESINLTNNLAQLYASSSFITYVLSDYLPVIKTFTDLFPSASERENASLDGGTSVLLDLFTTLLNLACNPIIFVIAPRLSTWIELQQTLGQYAYVHYNSTSIHKSKDLIGEADNRNDIDSNPVEGYNKLEHTDSVTFNRHIISQSAGIDDGFSKLIGFLASFFLSAADFKTSELTVNTHQNQTASSDKGKKYTTFFLNNMDVLASVDNVINGLTPTVNSKVAGVLSLDMFYSTSAEQKVVAGRGYVNHNFVTQCTAQSVTSHQMECSQVGANLIIKMLTLFEIDTLINAENATYTALQEQAKSVKEGSAWGSNFGWIAAAGLNVAAAAVYAHMKVLEVARDAFDQILDAMGAQLLKVSKLNGKSSHIYDVEGTHKYGSRSECFMWPCFGVDRNKILDEYVTAEKTNVPWKMTVQVSANILDLPIPIGAPFINGLITDSVDPYLKQFWKGDVNYFISNIKRANESREIELPEGMASVIGVHSYLPEVAYRNENIGESEPVFPTPPFQDYIIDDRWKLSQTASVGMTTWVGCDDTKLLDGEYSNIVVSDDFCGVACPYTAIEVKRGIDEKYIRPWAITPQALALNHTGMNCCFDHKAYHAFDGQGYRITNWEGAPGMNKEHQTWYYSFLVNDRLKRSNKLPQNEFLGNFVSEPETALKGDYNDKVFTLMTQPGENKGLTSGTIGEDKDIRRYAVPIFSEFVSTLPAVVKTISAFTLSTIDGVTSLTSQNRDLQTAYKAPLSIDFAIGHDMYRFTQEYICSLEQTKGVSTVKELVPCLGLTFLGSTPYEAYLYSQATRQYYIFSGGTQLRLVDMIERFRNVINGRYDFVNQEVLVPCLATFLRLDKNVYDDENETDNIFIGRLKDGNFIGELTPPIEPIFNTRSWYRLLSLPVGTVFQGPNRCIVNRFVVQEYMYEQIKENYGKWKRVPREVYHPFRKYKENYELVYKRIDSDISGWTHNPFLLVTAPLGVNSESDCQFEWEITFAWPVEMDRLYGIDNYATVNIQAQCMTPGGKVVADRPAHVFLTKELFTRTGNYGYYSFRYQSNCGAGNRERLHIWSDQFIAISSLKCAYKVQTQKRTEILTQQVDIQRLKEI